MNSKLAGPLTEDQLADLITFFATVIGLLLRLAFPLISSFPLNDGGLFYRMIRDLQSNGYALPAFTSYNHAQIPFAYPPLGFYIAGILADLTRVDLLLILRLLPALVSAACIPVFYLLAKQFTPSRTQAAVATLLFAFAQRVFAWQIMGGGITRAFGFLFALLTIYYASRLFTTQAARFVLWTSIWAALTILTHPEAILQTALAVLILYIFLDLSRKGLVLSVVAAAVILLLTSPWWGSVLSKHGFTPFLAVWSAASSNSNPLLARPVALFQFLITEEPFLPFIAFFGLLGTFRSLSQRKYWLPTWMVLPYMLDPRSGPLYTLIPLLLLASQGLVEVVLPAFNREQGQELTALLKSKVSRVFLGFVVLYLALAGYFSVGKIYGSATLARSQKEAMSWISQNTPEDASFILITNGQPLLDPASDWFPALTARRSVATVFGYEWIHDGQFAKRAEWYSTLQECTGATAACLTSWAEETSLGFGYVYLQTKTEFSPLKTDLMNSEGYVLVYEAENVSIWKRVDH
ncbi:MAG: glycosyltransferase family 39 protein [Chloroflexota bacterium]